MGDNHLDRVLPFLKKIDKKRREQFYAYFKNAPLWLLDSFSIEKMEKGRIFIKAWYLSVGSLCSDQNAIIRMDPL